MDQFRKYLVPTEKSEVDFPFIPREGIIHVNKRQSFGGINVRLSRLEFLSDATIATIDIENDNTDAELKLLEKCSNASQDTKQFLVRELSSPNIIGMDLKKSIHPNSSVWYGQVKFDPLDSKENKAKFNFRINKKVIRDTYNFTFDVNTSRQFIIKD